MFEFWIGKSLYGEELNRAFDTARKILLKHANLVLFPVNVRAYKVGGHQKHGGKKWTALEPGTVTRKAKRKREKILVDTSAMRSSLAVQVNQIGAFRFLVEVGVSVPYAIFHAEGRGLPQRLPVFVSKADLKKYRAGVSRDIETAINGNRK